MSSTNGEEPPLKKKKNKSRPSTEPNSIPSLPDDLIVSCLARVSRLHYPILSLVSKSFRSRIASPELHRTRTLLNRNESCLYVCLQFPPDHNTRWFALAKKPNQTLTKKMTKKKERSSGYALAPIRILNSSTVEWSNLIVVGSYLYAIRAIDESPPCSNISFLDCRTHTWLEAPSMRFAHTGTNFDGKLYLPGRNENPDSSSLSCIEVFNTKTQTWNHPVPPEKWLFEPRNMEGKIFRKRSAKMGWACKPKDMTWELVRFDKNSVRASMCVIENVIYCYSSSKGFEWSSDDNSDVWRKVKGLEELPKFAGYSNVTLVEYGGKMMVLWDKYVPAKGGYKEKMIWCAEISLEKRSDSEEIWGKVEWFDAVLTVPKSYEFVYAIAATI